MKNKFKTLKKNDIKAKIANGIWKFRTKFWNLQWPCGTLIVLLIVNTLTEWFSVFVILMRIICCIYSLRASSPIWASEASLARTRERAAKPRVAEDRPLARAFSRGPLRLPKQESLLAGYCIDKYFVRQLKACFPSFCQFMCLWNVPGVGAFDHLNGPRCGAFERQFGLDRGEFEQQFSKKSNARGDVEASIWPIHL